LQEKENSGEKEFSPKISPKEFFSPKISPRKIFSPKISPARPPDHLKKNELKELSHNQIRIFLRESARDKDH